jgi:rhamnogalacturonan acetylesterase
LYPANFKLNFDLGWGAYLSYSLTGVTVINDAIAGRSARSYIDEGRFAAIANSVVWGDWVIIEFGHSDGGSLTPPTTDGLTASVLETKLAPQQLGW